MEIGQNSGAAAVPENLVWIFAKKLAEHGAMEVEGRRGDSGAAKLVAVGTAVLLNNYEIGGGG